MPTTLLDCAYERTIKRDCSDSMTRIEGENDFIRESIAETSKQMQLPKKVVKSKTEMEESYFSKIEARLSAIESTNESLKAENIKLSAENEELKKQLAETPAEHTKFSPEAETKHELNFKIGAKREKNIKDRVFDSLF